MLYSGGRSSEDVILQLIRCLDVYYFYLFFFHYLLSLPDDE